jgi:AraC family transcriptional regulator, exoenzyme S synthesis regulatory protein ExsA
MFNLYEDSKNDRTFRQLECDDLLCVEYRCLPNDTRNTLWSQYGHLVFVTNGQKRWITPDGECYATIGDAVYCNRGACQIENFQEDDFCALLFFFPIDFIRETVLEYQESLNTNTLPPIPDFHVMKMNVDDTLKAFFDSVISYCFQKTNPSKHILKLKFKELILQVLTSKQNPKLAAYFLSTVQEEKVNLKKIMQDNLMYCLSLEDYAKICHMSLSSFKRNFKEIFGVAPGKWLIEQRLKYAKMRLLTTDESVNDVAFHAGFETTSNFIRCFKKSFGLPPLQYRQQALL